MFERNIFQAHYTVLEDSFKMTLSVILQTEGEIYLKDCSSLLVEVSARKVWSELRTFTVRIYCIPTLQIFYNCLKLHLEEVLRHKAFPDLMLLKWDNKVQCLTCVGTLK